MGKTLYDYRIALRTSVFPIDVMTVAISAPSVEAAKRAALINVFGPRSVWTITRPSPYELDTDEGVITRPEKEKGYRGPVYLTVVSAEEYDA